MRIKKTKILLKNYYDNNKSLMLLSIATFCLGILFGIVSNRLATDETIATFKGGAITSSRVQSLLKDSDSYIDTSSQLLTYSVYDKLYGNLATSKDVSKAYNELRDKDANFEDTLKKNGYSEKSYKVIIKQQLVYEKAIKKQITVNNAELKEAFKTFIPPITLRFMTILDENKADVVINKLNNGEDFQKLAKEYSQDSYQGQKIVYSYKDTYLPSKAISQASQENVGNYFKFKHTVGGSTVWFVIKVEKKIDKGNDYQKYRSELEDIVKTQKFSNSDILTAIIKKDFKKAKVEIEDKAVQKALRNYLE